MHTFLRNELTAFEPEAISALVTAYEQACVGLKIFAGDERGKQAVATRVIDLAKSGVIDAAAICNRVLEESRIAA